MDQKKIDRINFLAKKAKTEGLTPEEIKEREELRNEYRASFRMGLSGILDNTVIQYPDGTKTPVKRKPDAKC
ncbi:MAG: DUF896 domain-containing protein [Clostridia bacterium]|nr:DUF896 domain-containing protein [Clostridia bacterium]